MRPSNFLSVGAAGECMAPAARGVLRPPAVDVDAVTGEVLAVRFEIWPPASIKNNKALQHRRDGTTRIGSSTIVRHERRAIRLIAECAVAEWRGMGPLFGKDDDVELELLHLIDRDVVQVTVRRLGPPLEVDGRTGRRRDLTNLFEAIADALQSVIYGDDRQVARCRAARALTRGAP